MDCTPLFFLATSNSSISWDDSVRSFHVVAFFVNICKALHSYSAAVNMALCRPPAMEKWAPRRLWLPDVCFGGGFAVITNSDKPEPKKYHESTRIIIFFLYITKTLGLKDIREGLSALPDKRKPDQFVSWLNLTIGVAWENLRMLQF